MKQLYHCSPTASLKILQPNTTKYFDKPKQVCLTASLPMALMYGVKHFEYTYGYTKTQEIYYQEYFPNALEEIYRGKRASLYCCARREDMSATQIPNEYVTAWPVPVAEETVIPDVYKALLEQERLGTLKIIRWSELTNRRRQWIVQAEMETILEKNLLYQDTDFAHYIRDKYPESWELARQREKENK